MPKQIECHIGMGWLICGTGLFHSLASARHKR
jgi:hypothetical protein